jgi:hypothetical protein
MPPPGEHPSFQIPEGRARSIRVSDREIIVRLSNGKIAIHPISYSRRVQEATPQQRRNAIVVNDGTGLRWPEIDEVLSVETFIRDARRRK